MDNSQKFREVLTRSVRMMPAEAGRVILNLLSPASWIMVSGTLLIWGGSHFFGVGEFVDAILLIVGVVTLGLSVFDGAQELADFVETTVNAQTDADLDRAARHFAKAVSILGISVISALLLRSSAKAVRARGMPKLHQRLRLRGEFPSPGFRTISRPSRTWYSGLSGETDVWGYIAISRNQSIIEQRLALYHEFVHRILMPRFGPFQKFRSELRASGYQNSAFLRYLEEAMAESYAQMKVYGFEKIIVGIRFPLVKGKEYVTVSQLVTEGIAIGTIVVGDMTLTVRLVDKEWTSIFEQAVFD